MRSTSGSAPPPVAAARSTTPCTKLVVADLLGRSSARVQLPPAHHGWVSELTATWLDGVRSLGVDVVGDLADLEPAPADPATWQDPDVVPADVVAEASAAAARVLATAR